MNWFHGQNENQEYFHPVGQPKLCVCRNKGERHWVIYELRGRYVKMLPNPNASTLQLRFKEITDIPHSGEKFGDRPHHDGIGEPSVNYAFDSAEDAKRIASLAL